MEKDEKTLEKEKREIGNKLKILRGTEPLRSLADKLGLSFTTLQKIESGTNYPSPKVLSKLCEHFSVDRSFFFGKIQNVPEAFQNSLKWIAFGEEMEKYNLKPEEIENILRVFMKLNNKLD